MSIEPIHVPADVWRYIASFLPLKDLRPLFHTCKDLKKWSKSIFDILTRNEQSLMQINPYQGLNLSFDAVARTWRQLDLESCKNLAIFLKKYPLLLYPQFNRVAKVLLREDVVAAGGDSEKLLKLATGEREVKSKSAIGNALIIAESISDRSKSRDVIYDIFEKLSMEDALFWAQKIFDQDLRDFAYALVAVKPELPCDMALSIVENKIHSPKCKSDALEMITNEKLAQATLPREVILSIAEKIPDPFSREEAVGNIRKGPKNKGVSASLGNYESIANGPLGIEHEQLRNTDPHLPRAHNTGEIRKTIQITALALFVVLLPYLIVTAFQNSMKGNPN